MSKAKSSIAGKEEGLTFTPFIEEIAYWYKDSQPNGVLMALVFGKVYRFWCLRRESCRVSVRRLAGELSLPDIPLPS